MIFKLWINSSFVILVTRVNNLQIHNLWKSWTLLCKLISISLFICSTFCQDSSYSCLSFCPFGLPFSKATKYFLLHLQGNKTSNNHLTTNIKVDWVERVAEITLRVERGKCVNNFSNFSSRNSLVILCKVNKKMFVNGCFWTCRKYEFDFQLQADSWVKLHFRPFGRKDNKWT